MNRTPARMGACLALGLVLGSNALAQQGPGVSPRPWKVFLGMGVTGGGEKLTTVQWQNGGSTNIKSGGQIDIRAGVDIRAPGSSFGGQISVGQFFDKVNGSNGSVEFSRTPFELLGHWYASESTRIALGVRSTGTAKLKGTGQASNLGTTSFKTSTGTLAEVEWLTGAGGQFGFAGRYVVEKYTAPNGVKYDGNHAGLRFNWYF